MKRQKPASIPSGTLDGLVVQALKHLEDLDYKASTLKQYEKFWKRFLRFANERPKKDETTFTELVESFLSACGNSGKTGAQLNHCQAFTRTVMRVLTEFAFHGCFQLRAETSARIKLPPNMESDLAAYDQFCRENLRHRHGTLATRKRDIRRFLHYLNSRNITSVADIQEPVVMEFLTSRAHLSPTSLAIVASSLRSFLRFLRMQGLVPGALVEQVSRIRVQKVEPIPSVWNRDDLVALLAAVDRSSPVGKRNHAILLLAAQLGMRVSDIRSLRLEHLLWGEERIEFMQNKTGNAVILPLTEEIGSALIDYLRNGRPSTHHREVFLRANAPYLPLSRDNSLHNMISTYRRRSGITLPPKSRRGLHSLRHTLASRLLEAGTRFETISAIMGHQSLDSTRAYTKVDIEALRNVAIDPEEVVHV